MVYQVLSDPEMRRKYDKEGKTGVEEKAMTMDPAAFFSLLFGSERFVPWTGELHVAMQADHFNKALAQAGDTQAGEQNVPLSARNFPPSFWDSNWVAPPSLPPSGELYGDHWGSGDPWHNYMAAQMAVTGGSYSAHQMYHSARSYSSLLLHSRREWVEQNYTSPYSGLEGGMQPTGKDLYWF